MREDRLGKKRGVKQVKIEKAKAEVRGAREK